LYFLLYFRGNKFLLDDWGGNPREFYKIWSFSFCAVKDRLCNWEMKSKFKAYSSCLNTSTCFCDSDTTCISSCYFTSFSVSSCSLFFISRTNWSITLQCRNKVARLAINWVVVSNCNCPAWSHNCYSVNTTWVWTIVSICSQL